MFNRNLNKISVARVLDLRITLPIGLLLALFASITLPDGVSKILIAANDNGPESADGDPEDEDEDDGKSWIERLFDPDWAPPK